MCLQHMPFNINLPPQVEKSTYHWIQYGIDTLTQVQKIHYFGNIKHGDIFTDKHYKIWCNIINDATVTKESLLALGYLTN